MWRTKKRKERSVKLIFTEKGQRYSERKICDLKTRRDSFVVLIILVSGQREVSRYSG